MARIRTRARAVDMLGRQQIAGIQNALSEVFKNAHDAYATRVSVDYFEETGSKDPGFIAIRDDGIGMNLRDFEDKWLVLGTESKMGAFRNSQYKPPQMPERPITGEKGIGRLAIALLGRQVLVMTRAEREDGLADLVVALVHWGLFEQPTLNLEEIEVPLLTIKGGELPSATQVEKLKVELMLCVNKLASSHPDINFKTISSEIEEFSPDPAYLDSFFSSKDDIALSLKGGGKGTHFYIGTINPVLQIEIDSESKNNDFGFRKQILGFYDNVFNTDHPEVISTAFNKWLPGDLFGTNYLEPDTFFSTKELEEADHLLEGSIDEFGQFSGAMRVYDHTYESVIIPWNDNQGRHTRCGPFNIKFGYLMGRASESMLPNEAYNLLNSKLDNLGGMYVYRDNIRILPYGDHSNDWLEVEKRRNKGAGYYFFSFRRMFGAVSITRNENSELQEKAGREGFQQNEAYRQFKEILVNILIQLVAEFFRKGGSNTELFEKTQTDVRRRAEALEKQQKRASEKRKAFSNSLATFELETSSGLVDSSIANIRKLTQSRMEAASKIEDQDKAAASLIRAEQEATSQLNFLRIKYLRKKPNGVALTKELARDWEGYLHERARLEKEVFDPFELEISNSLGKVAEQARIYIDQRKRLEDRIRLLGSERKKELAEASKQANETASDTRKTVFKITEKARLALDQTIQSIQVDLNKTDLNSLPPEKIEEMRKRWEDSLTDIEEKHRDALMSARDMLASLAENLLASDGEHPAEIMEALEHRMLALEDQADEDFEMVQLGLAVAIINHEFAASIKRVRKSVQELGQISKKAGELKPLYESIRSNFEHLDGHLNLFTPLQKRIYRVALPITGKTIRNYINDLFSNRFTRHNIDIRFTEEFLNSTVKCYPSTLYPALINIIDNALFWLDSINDKKVILLDSDSSGFVISNNGPFIENRDAKNIFERGFSRKPSGRGLGLFISARALAAENMILSLQEPVSGFTVSFRIDVPNLT